jgi:anti-sigma regulatory factor (Ser/Thr protein kinase)
VSSVDVELPAEAASAAAARRSVRGLLVGQGSPTASSPKPRSAQATPPLDQAALDRVLLLTSEVVTNAILHARTPLRLTASLEGGQVQVRVYDRLRLLPRVRSYPADAGTGRGMHLVEALADEWGVEETPNGKCVWFCVAVMAGEQSARLG